MPEDVYTRMERAVRGREPGFRPLRQRLLEIALIVLSIFMLGYLLYAAQFSGTVRWFLGVAVLTLVALYAWHVVAGSTAEPGPMVKPQRPLRARGGDLTAMTAVVRRANQGLTYSQVAVSSRAREAFEERARLARGLTPEAMHALERDLVSLKATFGDATLADFLHLPTADSDARYRWVRDARLGRGFEVELDRILDTMEEWR